MTDTITEVLAGAPFSIVEVLAGAQGAPGRTLLNGEGAPDGSLGVDGDFYLDTVAHELYGPRAGGEWGVGVPLSGGGGATATLAEVVATGNTVVDSSVSFNAGEAPAQQFSTQIAAGAVTIMELGAMFLFLTSSGIVFYDQGAGWAGGATLTIAPDVEANTEWLLPGGGGTLAVLSDIPEPGATVEQGALADTAVQPGDLGTAAAQDVSAFATAAQGAKADTAVQPAGLVGLAPLASPTFTGVPAAPTPVGSDDSTKLATTAFVKAALNALVSGAPGLLDTLDEIATALGDDPNFSATMTTLLAGKAPLASPVFTGNPTAPTAAPGDADTTIATTAFVAAAVEPPEGSAENPHTSKTALRTGLPKEFWEYPGVAGVDDPDHWIDPDEWKRV